MSSFKRHRSHAGSIVGTQQPSARSICPVGSTAASVDVYLGDDIATTASNSTSVGLALVQNFDDQNIKLWGTWRTYRYDDSTASYENGQAVFGGVLFKF